MIKKIIVLLTCVLTLTSGTIVYGSTNNVKDFLSDKLDINEVESMIITTYFDNSIYVKLKSSEFIKFEIDETIDTSNFKSLEAFPNLKSLTINTNGDILDIPNLPKLELLNIHCHKIFHYDFLENDNIKDLTLAVQEPFEFDNISTLNKLEKVSIESPLLFNYSTDYYPDKLNSIHLKSEEISFSETAKMTSTNQIKSFSLIGLNDKIFKLLEFHKGLERLDIYAGKDDYLKNNNNSTISVEDANVTIDKPLNIDFLNSINADHLKIFIDSVYDGKNYSIGQNINCNYLTLIVLDNNIHEITINLNKRISSIELYIRKIRKANIIGGESLDYLYVSGRNLRNLNFNSIIHTIDKLVIEDTSLFDIVSINKVKKIGELLLKFNYNLNLDKVLLTKINNIHVDVMKDTDFITLKKMMINDRINFGEIKYELKDWY